MRFSAWRKVLALLVLGTAVGCATTTESTLPSISQIGTGKKALVQRPSPPSGKAAVTASAPANPKQYEADFKLARILERRNQLDRARRAYQLLLQQNPSDGRVYHRLGVMAAREGKLEQAEQYLQQAYQLGQRSPDLLADLGYLYYLQHRLDVAQQYLEQALQANPGHKRAAVNLGLVLGSQGKFDKALAMFRRTGDDAAAYANLAYVCTQLGEMDRAIHYYDQALSLNKNLRPAAEALAQLGERKRLLKQQRQKLARAARRKSRPTRAGSTPVKQAGTQTAASGTPAANTVLVGYTRSAPAAQPAPKKQQSKAAVANQPRRLDEPSRKAHQPKAAPAAAQTSVTAELWGTSTTSDAPTAADLPFGLDP